MKILVIGKSGQLARAFQELAKKSENEFIFLSKDDLDLSKAESVEPKLNLFQFDVLINCSAYTLVDQAETDREKAMQINASSLAVLAKVCIFKKAKLMHFSTDYVHSGEGYSGWSEASETKPINYYGQTKLAGEQLIINSGCRHLIFRTSWVYSAWGVNFVKTMLRLGAEREELSIVSDQIGSPTYSMDLAAGALAALKKWTTSQQDGIYNLCGSDNCSWFEFANEIFAEAKSQGIEIKIKKTLPILSANYKTVAPRPLNSKLNQSKIFFTFGIKTPSWKNSLKKCLQTIKDETNV